MKKRILSLCLAILMVMSVFPAPTYAADVTNDPSAQSNGYKVREAKITSVFPVLWEDPTDNSSYRQVSPLGGELPVYVKIVDEYKFSDTLTLYKLDAVDGETWPAQYDGHRWMESSKLALRCEKCGVYGCKLTHENWCDTCLKDDCGFDHSATEPIDPTDPSTPDVTDPSEPEDTCQCCESCTGAEGCECQCGECEFCEKKEDPSTPSEPEDTCQCCESCTGAEGCTCQCGECDFCEKEEEPAVPTISATVVDANGNPQTVTVSGEALPEGATLEVKPIANEKEVLEELDMVGGFMWDIKVFDADGNEWQPSEGQAVGINLPISGVPNNCYVDIAHYLDSVPAVRRELTNEDVYVCSIDGEPSGVAAFLSSAISAWQQATGKADNTYVVDLITNVKVVDGYANIELDSFSIFTFDNVFRDTYYDDDPGLGTGEDRIVVCVGNSRDSENGNTFYVHRGQYIALDTGVLSTSKNNWYITVERGTSHSFSTQKATAADFTISSTAQLGTKLKVGFDGNKTLKYYGYVYIVVIENRPVNYYNNDGSDNMTTVNAITDGYGTNQNAKAPSVSRTGYNFLGWYDAPSGGNRLGGADLSIMPSSAAGQNVYAQWEPIKYTIVFDPNTANAAGGTVTGNMSRISMTYDVATTLPRSKYVNNGNGVVFLGWATSPTGDVVYKDGQQVSNMTTTDGATITLYAKWKYGLASTVYIGINNTYHNPTGTYTAGGVTIGSYHTYPNEPAKMTGDFDRVTDKNVGWTYDAASDVPLKDKAEKYIKGNIFNSPDYKMTYVSGENTLGIADPTGRTVRAMLNFTEEDYNAMIAAWLNGMRSTLVGYGDTTFDWQNAKAEDFVMVPYVIKFQDYGTWYIDMVVVPKALYTLAYDGNIENGYTATFTGVAFPSSTLYKEGDSANVVTTPIGYQSNGLKVTKVVDGHTYEAKFLYWYDADGNTYGGTTGKNTITLTKDTILYAKWEYPDALYGNLEVTKMVVDKDSYTNPAQDQEFTFTFKTNAAGSYTYTIYDASANAKGSGTIANNGTFKLQNGWRIRIIDIPKGATYSFTETAVSYFTASGTVSGTVSAGATTYATVTNTYQKNAAYTVKHFLQNADKTGYTEQTADRQTLNGVINTNTAAAAKTYGGYVPNSFSQKTINANGSTVVEIYYDLLSPFTVTYYVDGDVYAQVEYLYGAEVSVQAAPSKTGYTFSGWTISGATASNGKFTMPAGNVTISGTFTANSYTVKFNANSGTGTMSSQSFTYDVKQALTANAFTKTGYKFTGWNTAADGSGTAYADKAEVKNLTATANGEVTLYAQWEQDIAYYTIETYLMGTDGKYPATPTTEVSSAQIGTTVSASHVDMTGFTADLAKSETSATLAANGTVLKLYYKRTEHTVIWQTEEGAVLETDTGVLYGVTPKYDGATPSKAATAQYTYTFEGWSPAVSAVTGNATYTAIFEPHLRSYTITWVDENGTVLETDYNVPYGETPTFDGATPTKAADNTYTYTFAGWSPSVSGVTGAATYTATYTSTYIEYTVIFKDWNGDVISSKNYHYGDTVAEPADPTKAADAQYTYTFAGWDKTVTTVSGSITYTAQYDSTVNKYTITWVDGNGNTLKTEKVEYGKTPAYSGSQPTKTATVQYTYTFSGKWSPEIVSVTEDATYTAQFDEIVNKYTVKFVNHDGSVLQSSEWEYGATPEYTAATPTKTADAQYTYTFAGWNPQIDVVTGNKTYTATYDSEVNKYTITWVDGDGNVIGTDVLDYGATPSYTGVTPTKTATAEFTYTFNNKWSPEIKSVTGDATYTAQFDAAVNYYTITWKNDNGVTLGTTSVAYGDLPAYSGATPTKAADAQYTYTHNGWTPSVVKVTGEATYTATYSTTVKKYTVTFKNWDGTVLQTGEVPYGTVPVYAGATPVKEQDNYYTYTFNNTWSPNVVAVTGAAEYVAQFDAADRYYTITWLNWDGTLLETDTAKYGQTVKYDGAAPTKAPDQQYWYNFEGWTGSNNVTFGALESVIVAGDATYTAVLNPKLQEYTVTWIVEGEIKEQKDWQYGQTPSFSYGVPEKAEDDGYTYHFSDWTPVVVPVVDRVEYKAVFEATAKVFDIEYVVTENGVTGTVSGNPATYTIVTPDFTLNNPVPTLPYYHFAGWSGTGITGKSDAVVIAQGSFGDRAYQAHYELNNYTITFNTNGADQATLAAVTYKYGDAVALPVVTKTGYTFVWKVEATSGNWNAGDVAASGTWEKYGDIQLIAEWTPNTYTIEFAANGGTGTMADMAMTYDVAKQLTPNAFTRTGYHFAGWKDEDGNTYADMQSVINLVAENGGEITLFAQWEINTVSLIINTHNEIDANQSYIFTVKGKSVDGREIELTVALGANDSQKIVNLPAGTYTISDQPAWSWRYAGQTIEQNVYSDKVVDFNYNYAQMIPTQIYWLNSYGNELLQVNTTKRKK